jgi:hypothetical protein
MIITAEEFIEAKFVSHIRSARFTIEPKHLGDDIREGDLLDILTEFRHLLTADNIGQSYNPRVYQFTVVDKDTATIIGLFDQAVIDKYSIE